MSELEKTVKDEKKVTKQKTIKDPSKPKRETAMTTQQLPLNNNLCDFFDIPHGSKMTRSDVTKKFWEHVKQNSLNQNKIISCDAKLKKLFDIADNQSFNDKFGENLVFNNVAKHFKQFYIPLSDEEKLEMKKQSDEKKESKKQTELTNEEKPPKKSILKKIGGEKDVDSSKDDKNNEIALKKTVCKFFELPEKSKMNNLDFFNNHLKKHILEQSNGEYKFDEKFMKLLKLDDRKYTMNEINTMIQ
jgi:hypothetical protein